MTDQKMLPCPHGHGAEFLSVYKYDSGCQHVECDYHGCMYLGPGSGSRRMAIKLHNERIRAALAASEQKP